MKRAEINVYAISGTAALVTVVKDGVQVGRLKLGNCSIAVVLEILRRYDAEILVHRF